MYNDSIIFEMLRLFHEDMKLAVQISEIMLSDCIIYEMVWLFHEDMKPCMSDKMLKIKFINPVEMFFFIMMYILYF